MVPIPDEMVGLLRRDLEACQRPDCGACFSSNVSPDFNAFDSISEPGTPSDVSLDRFTGLNSVGLDLESPSCVLGASEGATLSKGCLSSFFESASAISTSALADTLATCAFDAVFTSSSKGSMAAGLEASASDSCLPQLFSTPLRLRLLFPLRLPFRHLHFEIFQLQQ